jgi:hypothetical protein
MPTFTQAHVRSLATSAVGDQVRVELILFEGLRAHCAQIGIREGDRLRCCSVTPATLVFETSAGTLVALEQKWACFIQVGTPSEVASLQT